VLQKFIIVGITCFLVGFLLGIGGTAFFIYQSTKNKYDEQIKRIDTEFNSKLDQYKRTIEELATTESKLEINLKSANDRFSGSIQSSIKSNNGSFDSIDRSYNQIQSELDRLIESQKRFIENNEHSE
jgi:hypothetical protein